MIERAGSGGSGAGSRNTGIRFDYSRILCLDWLTGNQPGSEGKMEKELDTALGEWWSACWGGTLEEEAEKKAKLNLLKDKYGEQAYKEAIEAFNESKARN